jgi:uncharacterized membrane protein HdeD (DUF308 family)
VLVGVMALIWPGITVFVLVVFFGANALVDGVVALLAAASGGRRSAGGRAWLVMGGIAGILAGVLTFASDRVAGGGGDPAHYALEQAVGLSVTLTFLSLVFWTFVLGALGTLLAVPLMLLVNALLVDADPGARWLRPLLGDTTAAPPTGAAPDRR